MTNDECQHKISVGDGRLEDGYIIIDCVLCKKPLARLKQTETPAGKWSEVPTTKTVEEMLKERE